MKKRRERWNLHNVKVDDTKPHSNGAQSRVAYVDSYNGTRYDSCNNAEFIILDKVKVYLIVGLEDYEILINHKNNVIKWYII